MGPKKKDKKQKNGKKEKEKPQKTLKSEYLAKIADRNAVLAAARKRIQNVEDVYFGTEKRYEQTQEDMADIIKYLQHEIEENELEIAAFDEKIAAYKEEINKNDKYYQAIISEMETEYEEKEKALQYQIQQNAAKLSAFEEVKHQREEYLKKKEKLYRKLQEIQARNEREIYEAEKQAITKQDTMQKEMESNLTKLAVDFGQATDLAIGETTNKLIRDNIALGNMLTCTQEIFESARDSYQKVHALEKLHRYNAELLEEEHDLILQKYTKQVNRIETLLKSHEDLREKILVSEKLIKDNRRLQRQIAEKECILRDKVVQLSDLSKVLNDDKEIFISAKNVFNSLRRNVLGLEYSLYEAAKNVKLGIDIENITRLVDETGEDITETDKEEKEQEEDLKEFKYKTRKNAIEEAIERLKSGLISEPEVPPPESSDSYLMVNDDSTTSDFGAIKKKLKMMERKRIDNNKFTTDKTVKTFIMLW